MGNPIAFPHYECFGAIQQWICGILQHSVHYKCFVGIQQWICGIEQHSPHYEWFGGIQQWIWGIPRIPCIPNMLKTDLGPIFCWSDGCSKFRCYYAFYSDNCANVAAAKIFMRIDDFECVIKSTLKDGCNLKLPILVIVYYPYGGYQL